MSPHNTNSSIRLDPVEPRRRSLRSSGVTGHRVRTVAGLPTVRATLPQDPPAAFPSSVETAEPSVANTSTSVITPLPRKRPYVEADAAQFPKWTYIAAGAVAALLCFVATRPVWQRSHGPAPVMIDESNLPATTGTASAAGSATAPPREYVALPASTPPSASNVYAVEEIPVTAHPMEPASDPSADQSTRRQSPLPTELTTATPTPGGDWPDEQDSSPRLANREAEESVDSGSLTLDAPSSTPASDYPSTNYPTVVPYRVPSAGSTGEPAGGPSLPEAGLQSVGNARLDGNIEPFRSDES